MQLSGSTGYIFNYEAGDIIFGTSATTRLTLKAAGQAIFTGDLTCSDDLYLNSANAWIISGSAGSLLTGGTLRIQSFAKLRVDGGLKIGEIANGSTRYTTSAWSNYLELDAASSGGGGIIWSKQSNSKQSGILSNHGKLEIGYSTATDNSAAWVPALTIDDAAKVGIGTTLPAKKLTVIGGNIALVGGSSVGNFFMPLSTGNGDGGFMFSSAPNNTTQNYGTGVVGSMFFKSGDGFHVSATGAYVLSNFVIKTDGKVGIGTSAPGYLLQVQGDSYFTDLITTGQLGIKLYSGWGGVGTTYSGGQLFVGFNVKTIGSGDAVQASNTHANGAGWAHMKCTGYGTGITFHTKSGNTTAGESATGNVRMQIYGNGSISMSGALTVGGTITENSSIALKENIFDLNTTLDKINRVRPVKYNKKISKNKKEIGFIAEELAEIFPELVENDENGNPTSVNYTRAVTVLFDGFKQMYKELKEIKERIK
jgi:hypothetical protein